jgi:hypothetical protein
VSLLQRESLPIAFRRVATSSPAILLDDFAAIIVSATETLWNPERCSGRLCPRLRKSELRELFLRELANVKQRAQQLQVLNRGRA